MRFMYYYIIHNIPNILYLISYEMYLAFQLNQLGNNDKNYFNHLYTHACTPIFYDIKYTYLYFSDYFQIDCTRQYCIVTRICI